MMNIHESQEKKERPNIDEDKTYSPIENYQRIAAGGTLKKQNLNMKTLPRGIRFIGYFFIVFFILALMLIIILNIF